MVALDGPLPPPRMPPPHPWVILLVDDEPDTLDSIKETVELSMPGTRVLAVPTAREGLDLLDTERIDCIIADFRMPGMDGIEFLYQARKAHPHVPRVMLTAFIEEEQVRRAITDHFVDEFIPKSTAPEEFLTRIARFLEYERTPRPTGTGAPHGRCGSRAVRAARLGRPPAAFVRWPRRELRVRARTQAANGNRLKIGCFVLHRFESCRAHQHSIRQEGRRLP
jgi:CheY-like chemotaxis protein